MNSLLQNLNLSWFEDSWWSWGNCINFRFVNYEDDIDRKAFFEELNNGWYQMYIYPWDDMYIPIISDERKMRLAEKPYRFYVPQEDYDALVEAIENPPKPSQGLIDLMNRPSPFKNNE